MDDKVQPQPTVPVDLLEGYRETAIGPLPEEWEVVPLVNVTTKVFGGGTPSTKKVEFWDGPIPWTTTAIIGEEDIYLGDFQRGITEEGLLNSSTQIAPENSVLLGTRVGVGKAVVTPFEVAVNQDLTVLVPSPAARPEFLALLMKEPSMQRWFSENKRGTTIKGVPRTDVLGLHIPLPPLPEQRTIAHVLRTVQEAKEDTEKVIEATRELKRSLMNHLFTYGPVPVHEAERVPLKDTQVGSVPEHWEIVSLGEVARSRFKNGIFIKGPKWGTGTRYLNVADVYPNSVVRIEALRLLEIPSGSQQGFEVESPRVYRRLGSWTPFSCSWRRSLYSL